MVAIGEAAGAVVVVYEGRCPVVTAESMDEAVSLAHQLADENGIVLLSPGCSSFDWYGSYDERGRDFQRLVGALVGTVGR